MTARWARTCLTVKARGCVERLILCVIKRTIIAAISLFIDSFKGCVWDSLDSSVTSCPPCLPFIPSYGTRGKTDDPGTWSRAGAWDGFLRAPSSAAISPAFLTPLAYRAQETGGSCGPWSCWWPLLGTLPGKSLQPHECLEIHSLGRKGSGEHACYSPWWLLRESRAQTGQPWTPEQTGSSPGSQPLHQSNQWPEKCRCQHQMTLALSPREVTLVALGINCPRIRKGGKLNSNH